MRFIFLISILYILPSSIYAQQNNNYLKGKVTGLDDNKQQNVLTGANIFWKGTQIGTISNNEGWFSLKKLANNKTLIVSFIGYQNDTIDISGKENINIKLKPLSELEEVNVVYRKKGTETDFLNPLTVKNISEKELTKAACCNLSESFETNPAVDVSFTDAVTGTRQIMMLGLAGPYTQITRENIPDVRGISAIYGLSYIPGPWIESIQLIKGTGSVANGYESIAGQINVELRKPESMDKLYLNAYANEGGRFEANANFQQNISKRWTTGFLVHASNNSIQHDRNDDGFLDHPLSEQYIILNRWKFSNANGLHFQAGAKATYIDKVGGQLDFKLENDEGTTNSWGMHLLTKRLEGWTKIGKVNEEKPYQSIGFQMAGALHQQHSFFGLNQYEAEQNTFYSNFLFQSIIGNTNHKYRTGFSFQYDDYKEELNSTKYDRIEYVPGAFFEYTYSYLKKFSLVAGLRTDYHNSFGAFVTPRLHIRYAATEKTIIRLSGGRGQRTANIISENNGSLASSRQFTIQGNNNNKPYGLNPEVAWNFGISLTQHFIIDYRDGFVSIDFFRTDFENQIVVDQDQNPQQLVFYNLNGKSFSNSFQVQVDYELIKRLDFRLAYRWYDVQSVYSGTLRQKPLIAQHRAFINLAYQTRKYFTFDYTLNWQGNKRIPDTFLNPPEYQLAERSPHFFMMNVQISKSWRKLFDVYLGVENLLNYKQNNPILASDQPFSPYFDGSLVWGPVFGRNIYIGLRYKIK